MNQLLPLNLKEQIKSNLDFHCESTCFLFNNPNKDFDCDTLTKDESEVPLAVIIKIILMHKVSKEIMMSMSIHTN